MKFEIINPIDYPDWDSLLQRSHDHSFFHTSAWAKVLSKSYRYKPTYFATIANDHLDFLMPLMEVSSFLTGKRGISLPFTDQCAPHASETGPLPEAVHEAVDYGRKAGWRYIEWRDARYFAHNTPSSDMYYTHDIDLAMTEPALFSSLGDSNRRSIRKAAKEGVTIKIDRSLDSVLSFYRLNCLTRKRHGLPPQPFVFFKNVYDHVISAGCGIVVSACHSGKAVAAAVFFHFGDRAIYKYGASDMTRQHLRPNNLAMWEALRWYRERGFVTMNLGRTEPENLGLLQYKRGWGAIESPLAYFRYEVKKEGFIQGKQKKGGLAERLFSRTPVGVLRLLGRVFYRHVA